jgi:hypothetical protein
VPLVSAERRPMTLGFTLSNEKSLSVDAKLLASPKLLVISP